MRVDRLPAYPPARRLDLTEDLHGHRVVDPYRWLEDAGSVETRAWAEAQDALAGAALDALPGRAWWRSTIERLMPGSVSTPVAAGNRLFLTRRRPEQEHPVLVVLDHVEDGLGQGGPALPAGAGRVLLDPSALSGDATTTLDGWVPSIEGDLVACFISEGGAEEASLSVLDAGTGEVVDGPIVLGRSFGLAWLPGGEEYVYVRRLPDDRLPPDEGQFHRRVWCRRKGTPVAEDRLWFGEGRDRTTYYDVSTSPDGRWLVVSASLGTAPRNDVYLSDLTALGSGEVPAFSVLQEGVDALTSARMGPDGRLYVHTNLDAPRWRLAVTDPARPGPESWTDLVPEGTGVLEGYVVTDDAVVTVVTEDVASHVAVHDRASGALREPVPLPGPARGGEAAGGTVGGGAGA
ncbi:MAG: prolyl oligopeptidase family serine peptidase, partial [Acidimicrobiales bacterium]